MKTQNDTSARVQTYTFDHGDLNFTIDHAQVKEAALLDDKMIDQMIVETLKTLVHKSKERPLNRTDGTEWLISYLSGGTSTVGRYRITGDDREKLANCKKQFKMAPEQATKQFNDNNAKYGVKISDFLVEGELQDEPLLKFYLRRRAAIDAEKKAEKSMM